MAMPSYYYAYCERVKMTLKQLVFVNRQVRAIMDYITIPLEPEDRARLWELAGKIQELGEEEVRLLYRFELLINRVKAPERALAGAPTKPSDSGNDESVCQLAMSRTNVEYAEEKE